MPLLLPDSPVVVWWPYDAPAHPAIDPLGAMAQRRITDAQHAPDPSRAVAARAEVYADGDTDLVWTRTTRWRGILAAALEQPPFHAFSVACGITFTFGGLHVNRGARVLDGGGTPLPGLYAAGELVGGLFSGNYPGGSGLTAGAVFGRRAGASAAERARSLVRSGT